MINHFLTALLVSGIAAWSIHSFAAETDYAKDSKARKWGLYGETKALFSGKVVDVLCTLTGDCPENCGDGKRHLGIVRSDDNQLVLVLKNRQAAFNGATEDLLPYCEKQVDVDGVLIGKDKIETAYRFYMVQLIRESGEEKWNKTTLWTKRWAEKNPNSKGKGPWFRRDPRVKKQLEKSGHFGLGHAVDQKFAEEAAAEAAEDEEEEN